MVDCTTVFFCWPLYSYNFDPSFTHPHTANLNKRTLVKNELTNIWTKPEFLVLIIIYAAHKIGVLLLTIKTQPNAYTHTLSLALIFWFLLYFFNTQKTINSKNMPLNFQPKFQKMSIWI